MILHHVLTNNPLSAHCTYLGNLLFVFEAVNALSPCLLQAGDSVYIFKPLVAGLDSQIHEGIHKRYHQPILVDLQVWAIINHPDESFLDLGGLGTRYSQYGFRFGCVHCHAESMKSVKEEGHYI